MKLLSVNVGLPREIEWKGKVSPHFYIQERELTAGDSIELLERDDHNVTVADVVNLYGRDVANQLMLRQVSELPTLPKNWRDYFRKRLWNPDDT